MNDILLTVSGNIPADLEKQTAEGQRPETDYQALARTLPADLLDYSAAVQSGGAFGRFLTRMGGRNLGLAWACFRLRGRYRAIFTDGEQVGIPLAALLKFFTRRRPRHVMIGHILSVGKKMALFDVLRLSSHIDTFVVYSSWQKHFIEKRWGVPPARVVLSPFMVNSGFFHPMAAAENPYSTEFPDPMICAVGLEFRDYPTLIEAVRGLDTRVVIAAASPWSKRSDTTAGQDIPPNVTVRRFTQRELRDLYAASRFLVMPLYDVNFQAGVTAILEAMAMGKAVICSRTPGQTDVIVEGETGLYVPAGDISALREAIVRLLENPTEAERMGSAGRRRVDETMSLECYTQRLRSVVRETLAKRW